MPMPLSALDIFVGVSAPGIVTEEMVASMNRDGIFVCHGKIRYRKSCLTLQKKVQKVVEPDVPISPNQVNNVVAFPGIFKRCPRGTCHTDYRRNEISSRSCYRIFSTGR